jgi:hypothetical protein
VNTPFTCRKPCRGEVGAHLLEIVVGRELALQVERVSGAIAQRAPDLGAVDRAARAQRLDRRLPALPSLEVALRELGAARHHGARRREQLVHELGEGRLGQIHHRTGARVAVLDAHARIARDPRERRAARAERERGHAREIAAHEVAVARDQRGQLRAMERDEGNRFERARDRLDPRQARARDVRRHGRSSGNGRVTM